MKWAKQKLALKAPEIEKTEESEDAKKEGAKDDNVEMKEEKTECAKKVEMAGDSNEGEENTVDVKKDDNDPSGPQKTDPNHPDNLEKAEGEKKGTSNPRPSFNLQAKSR